MLARKTTILPGFKHAKAEEEEVRGKRLRNMDGESTEDQSC
jgi:hypothetical protein